MKKFFIVALVAVLAVAISVPASAIEHEFSGYWRTRAYTQKNFSGNKDKAENQDVQAVDTRTRLWYTAKFSEDFKFVNGFEMDAVWGGYDGLDNTKKSYGRVGTDGVNVQIKHSYVDFNLENFNFKIGAQPGYLARGLIMDEDFAGAVITGNFGNVSVPFYWIKNIEGGIGKDYNDFDADTIVIAPEIKIDNMRINPFISYTYMNKNSSYKDENNVTKYHYDVLGEGRDTKNLHAVNLGVDFDFALSDNSNLWFTGIYQWGEFDVIKNDEYKGHDISAYLIAFGGNLDVEGIDLHGQFFYASGDDNGEDRDKDNFLDLTQGQSYYWAEIMGYGMVDNQWSAGSCGDKISNIMAFNLGASMSPMEKLTVGADVWAAWLAEDDENKENYLGTELDLSASYQLMDNLVFDVVAAYLFAGDATSDGKKGSENDKDPYQLAAQLSFSF
ncbi:MAG: hypothetical protein RBR53_09045 [Desulforegulaceae bacterium]|nr:hypothetical protein [Desulforegulaceae bacterium]